MRTKKDVQISVAQFCKNYLSEKVSDRIKEEMKNDDFLNSVFPVDTEIYAKEFGKTVLSLQDGITAYVPSFSYNKHVTETQNNDSSKIIKIEAKLRCRKMNAEKKKNKLLKMRPDYDKIKSDLCSIAHTLIEIASKIETQLLEIFAGTEHIARIGCSVKAVKSFLNKTLKQENRVFKYQTPLKEIQDLIGARVVVYYKTVVDAVVYVIKKFFNFIEKNKIVPYDVMKFGYEGLHFICFIPNTIFSDHKSNPLIPDFFELQIKNSLPTCVESGRTWFRLQT